MAKATAKKAAPSSTTKSGGTTASKSNSSSSNGSSSSNVNSRFEETGLLEKFFVDGLKDIYWAEKHLTKAIPKMIKAATSPQLKRAFTDHLAVTKVHVGRLEEIFGIMGVKAQAKKCDAMEGLLKEGTGIMEDTRPGAVRDAGIIAASQKIEHYEIATYGTLAAFAKVLGEKTALKNLLKTLEEEKKCDELLTSIADTALNTAAMK